MGEVVVTQQQPADWHLVAAVYDTAEHQIRIQGGGGQPLNWSCTCQARRTRNGCPVSYQPIGYIDGEPIEEILARHMLHVLEAA